MQCTLLLIFWTQIIIIVYRPFSMLRTGWTFSPNQAPPTRLRFIQNNIRSTTQNVHHLWSSTSSYKLSSYNGNTKLWKEEKTLKSSLLHPVDAWNVLLVQRIMWKDMALFFRASGTDGDSIQKREAPFLYLYCICTFSAKLCQSGGIQKFICKKSTTRPASMFIFRRNAIAFRTIGIG